MNWSYTIHQKKKKEIYTGLKGRFYSFTSFWSVTRRQRNIQEAFEENVVYYVFAHKRTADVIVRKYFGKEASFDDRAVKKRTLPNKLLFRSQLEECIFKKFGLWFHPV